MIFLFFGERGKRGKGFRVANVNWGFEGLQVTSKLPASYQQVRGDGSIGGIKVEFGGFISGFGKIFFTKGGIKREKEGFRVGGRVNLYFFNFFWGGGGEFEILWGNVFLGLWVEEGKRKKGKE